MPIDDQKFDDANKLINYLTELAVSKNNVFRGYGKQSELLPNIIRDKDWTKKEIMLLYEFERYGLQYFAANSPIDFMSYAQHYGLPTRLLDFTFNPFVALYFALFIQKSTNYKCKEDETYYYIRYCNLNENIQINTLPYLDGGQLPSYSFTSQSSKMMSLIKTVVSNAAEENNTDKSQENIKSYFKNIYCEEHPDNIEPATDDLDKDFDEKMKKFKDEKILFINANQCNQRIVMQQGLFMFPYILDKNRHMEIIKKNTSVIKINKKIRNNLQEYLDTMGINAYRLMPDLQSVCNAASQRIKEMGDQSIGETNIENIEEIHSFLKEAYEKYANGKNGEFVNIAQVGAYIKKNIPNFKSKVYGYPKLSALIKGFPDKYEVKMEEGSGPVPIVVYKCI